jgi:tyrosine-specific transport protein
MLKKRGTKQTGFFANNKLLIAITTLIGTIVGAGILGIPYAIAKVGFFWGFIIIVTLGLCFILINLFAGEMILRTKKQHQLTGYAQKYLGKWGKIVMTLVMLMSLYGALIAYLIGEGSTLYAIFGFGSPLIYTLIFFAITSYIIFSGIKATGKTELVLISLLIIIVFVIGVFSYRSMDFSRLLTSNITNFLLPYGIVLFAYMALPAIPELQEVIGKEKKLLKKAIIWGSVIPIIIYLFFAAVVVGAVGLENFELLDTNQRIATIALSIYSNKILGVFANILAVLAMFTSYLTIGIALTEMYEYDYKLNRKLALSLTFFIPLIVVLFNLTSFLTVLAITGAIAGGLEAVMVMLMYWRAKKLGDRKPEYTMPNFYVLGGIILVMFLIGSIYQFIITLV